MCHPRTILRMNPVTLRGLGCSHEYVVGHRTGDSRLRGNDVGFGDVLAAMAASFTLHAPAASHMP